MNEMLFFYLIVLDILYDALRNYSFGRFESFDLRNENNRLSEKIIVLETRIDRLVDRERTFEDRIEFWRDLYVRKCKEFLKLKKLHERCPKKTIFLYR